MVRAASLSNSNPSTANSASRAVSHVRINSGDWVFGDMDGVVAIPADRVDEVLEKAEKMGALEDIVREAVRNGADVKDVFDKYGRL